MNVNAIVNLHVLVWLGMWREYEYKEWMWILYERIVVKGKHIVNIHIFADWECDCEFKVNVNLNMVVHAGMKVNVKTVMMWALMWSWRWLWRWTLKWMWKVLQRWT